MCYSGCVYENYHGACNKPPKKACPDEILDQEDEDRFVDNLIQEEEDYKKRSRGDEWKNY